MVCMKFMAKLLITIRASALLSQIHLPNLSGAMRAIAAIFSGATEALLGSKFGQIRPPIFFPVSQSQFLILSIPLLSIFGQVFLSVLSETPRRACDGLTVMTISRVKLITANNASLNGAGGWI